MRLTRGELAGLVLATMVLAWVGWGGATVDRRVDADLAQMQSRAAARWTAWVDTGVPTDSATQLALADLRARLAGDLPPRPALPFVGDPDLEWLWQARMLNPFHGARRTVPRTADEAQALLDARADLRNIVAAGRTTRHEVRLAEAQRAFVVGSVLLALVLGVIAYRVHRRAWVSAQLAALRVR